jgi:hypothetical protein
MPLGSVPRPRRAAVVYVVAFVVACERAPDLMMEVVGPHGIESPPARRRRGHHVRQVAVIFGDQQHAALAGSGTHPAGELGEEVSRALVDQRVRGVEAQAVDVVLVDPVQSIFEEEVAHHVAVRAVEVHGVAPWCLMAARKVVRAEAAEVVAVGAEVVVDDVENHAEPHLMRGIHQAAEVVGRAIAARRREQGDAIVAPVARPGKVGDRHQLERRDPEVA